PKSSFTESSKEMAMPVTVTIDHPDDKSDVPGGGSFYTDGFVTPSNAQMTAWVDDSGTRTDGTPSDVVPPHQWAFDFSGVQTGVFVTLNVQGTQGGETGIAQITIRCTDGRIRPRPGRKRP